jgi:hypothetical protein
MRPGLKKPDTGCSYQFTGQIKKEQDIKNKIIISAK